jgi:hypothetical protein
VATCTSKCFTIEKINVNKLEYPINIVYDGKKHQVELRNFISNPMCTTVRVEVFSAGFLGSCRTKIAFWLTVGACRKEFGADCRGAGRDGGR